MRLVLSPQGSTFFFALLCKMHKMPLNIFLLLSVSNVLIGNFKNVLSSVQVNATTYEKNNIMCSKIFTKLIR